MVLVIGADILCGKLGISNNRNLELAATMMIFGAAITAYEKSWRTVLFWRTLAGLLLVHLLAYELFLRFFKRIEFAIGIVALVSFAEMWIFDRLLAVTLKRQKRASAKVKG